jgi:predicted phage-related endonuclease
MSDTAAEYLVRKTELKESEKQVNALYDKLVGMYLEGKRPTDAFKMSMSTCKHTGFDTKRFAEEHPDVYEQYKTVSEYTRTTVKKR